MVETKATSLLHHPPPKKHRKAMHFDGVFMFFLVYGKFCVLVWGVRKNGGRIFLVLLQMINASFFQLSSMAEGYKSIHWNPEVLWCWKLEGIQKEREFPTSKGTYAYKVPTNQ